MSGRTASSCRCDIFTANKFSQQPIVVIVQNAWRQTSSAAYFQHNNSALEQAVQVDPEIRRRPILGHAVRATAYGSDWVASSMMCGRSSWWLVIRARVTQSVSRCYNDLTTPRCLYRVNHKKRDILFLTISLANLNRLLQSHLQFFRD